MLCSVPRRRNGKKRGLRARPSTHRIEEGLCYIVAGPNLRNLHELLGYHVALQPDRLIAILVHPPSINPALEFSLPSGSGSVEKRGGKSHGLGLAVP
jgi:hypothetical protein